jgi:hypothetical protein
VEAFSSVEHTTRGRRVRTGDGRLVESLQAAQREISSISESKNEKMAHLLHPIRFSRHTNDVKDLPLPQLAVVLRLSVLYNPSSVSTFRKSRKGKESTHSVPRRLLLRSVHVQLPLLLPRCTVQLTPQPGILHERTELDQRSGGREGGGGGEGSESREL